MNACFLQFFEDSLRFLYAHSSVGDQNECLLDFPTSGKRKARRLQSLLKQRTAPTGNGTDLSRCHLGKAFTVLEYRADRLLGVSAGYARKHRQRWVAPAYSFKPQNESEARSNRKIAPAPCYRSCPKAHERRRWALDVPFALQRLLRQTPQAGTDV